MGFLDKLRRKKDEIAQDVNERTTDKVNPPEKRIKRYTSDGRPVYD